MRVLVTGSTGLLGSYLIPRLQERGHEVWRLVRHQPQGPDEVHYDKGHGKWTGAHIPDFEGVVHLAGESLIGRWTAAKKRAILESREMGTKSLVEALNWQSTPPSVFVSASAVGYYGDRGDELLTEESAPGHTFLSTVCKRWEEASAPLKQKGVRTVFVRLGVVLSHLGGLLPMILPFFKYGLGSEIGTGKQYMPWISLEDAAALFLHALEDTEWEGPVNAVSPEQVTNATFTHTLSTILHRPSFFRLPAWCIRLALGELGNDLLLASQRVVPMFLEKHKYSFFLRSLEDTLAKK